MPTAGQGGEGIQGMGMGMGTAAGAGSGSRDDDRGRPSLTVEMTGGSSGGRRGYRAAWTPLRAPAYPTVSFPPSMMLKVIPELFCV